MGLNSGTVSNDIAQCVIQGLCHNQEGWAGLHQDLTVRKTKI